jgi:hypothetical protein
MRDSGTRPAYSLPNYGCSKTSALGGAPARPADDRSVGQTQDSPESSHENYICMAQFAEREPHTRGY